MQHVSCKQCKKIFSVKKLDSHCQTRISTEGRDR